MGLEGSARLDAAVRRVCPDIDGVSPDGDGWKIHFKKSASAEQRAAARDVVAAFDASVPTVDEYVVVVNAYLDQVAQDREYSSALSLVSYAGSQVTAWAGEAAAFIEWRDQVWSYLYQQLALYDVGERAAPALEGVVAELPAINWPS